MDEETLTELEGVVHNWGDSEYINSGMGIAVGELRALIAEVRRLRASHSYNANDTLFGAESCGSSD
jgi:hypothetical protein